jgi:hypothetical protein
LDPRLRRCSKANAAAPVGVELVLRSSIQKREDGDVVHTMFAWIEVTGTGPGFAAGPIRFREAECEGR